jgi:Protein of unknown function (DUF4446)
MDELTTTVGIVAMAGAAVGLIGLILAIVLAVRLRGVRNAQRAVLGEGRTEDLVAHAAGLEEQFHALHAFVEDAAGTLHDRVSAAEARLDGAIAYRALVRFDAYGETGGRQSTTVAMLDAHKSGVVITSIHHREQARMYAKLVHEGRSEITLSPEEAEAVRMALAGEPGEVPSTQESQATRRAPEGRTPEGEGALPPGAEEQPAP